VNRVLLSVPGKAAHHHADDAMLCAQAEILCDGWCEWDRSEMELAVARKIRWNFWHGRSETKSASNAPSALHTKPRSSLVTCTRIRGAGGGGGASPMVWGGAVHSDAAVGGSRKFRSVLFEKILVFLPKFVANTCHSLSAPRWPRWRSVRAD